MESRSSLEVLIGLVNKKPVDKIETFDDDDSRVNWSWFEIIMSKSCMVLRIEDPENCRKSYDFERSLQSHTNNDLVENFNNLIAEFKEFVEDKHKSSERWRNGCFGIESGCLEFLSEIKACEG